MRWKTKGVVEAVSMTTMEEKNGMCHLDKLLWVELSIALVEAS